MKKLLLVLAFMLLPSLAYAQCTGIFAPGTVCGNNSGASQPPFAITPLNGGVTNAMLAQMSANTVKCNPTTSTANPQDCSYPTINVKDYGATGNGSTDDTTSIQNAINALPVGGGVVQFPVGNYKVSSTINVGNGTSSTASTRQGIVLQGIGNPNTQPIWPGFTATTGPKLTWAGSGAGGIISINGPLQGWGVQNLYLDCAGVASAVGLAELSAQQGDVRNITIVNCFTGLSSNSYAHFGSFTNTNTMHNKHYATVIEMPTTSGATGIFLTGTSTDNTCCEDFIDTHIAMQGTANAVVGIKLQLMDTVHFTSVHIYGVGATPSATCVQFDYSANASFPGSNRILGIDAGNCGGGTVFANNGTPSGVTPNIIFIDEANGTVCPLIANVACQGSHSFVTNPGNNVVGTDILSAWTTYTPSPSCGTATFTVNSARSKTAGKTTSVQGDISFTALGTCTNIVTVTLPAQAGVATGYMIIGQELTGGGVLFCKILTGGTTATCAKNGGANFTGSDRLLFTGIYENN